MKIVKLLEIINQEMEKRNFSQAKLVKIMKSSASTVSETLSGKRGLTMNFYLNFCSALRISPSDLLRKWERSEEYQEIDSERRNAYKKTIDNMIKFGHGLELDSLLTYFEGLVKEEKRRRAVERSKREVQPS